MRRTSAASPARKPLRRATERTSDAAPKKTPVVALVCRNGDVRSKPIVHCDAVNLKWMIREHVAKESTIVTDDFSSYRGIGSEFDGGNHVVNHSGGEYVRGDFHTNTAESYFSL